MVNQPAGGSFQKSLKFPQDFNETFIRRFEILIKSDENILKYMSARDKNSARTRSAAGHSVGYFNPAVRYLIELYVRKKWPTYVANMKAAKQRRQNEQTQEA